MRLTMTFLLTFCTILTACSPTSNNQSNSANTNSASQTSSTLSLGTKGQQVEEKILRGEALSSSDIEGLSKNELRILRNVHFARYGRKYESPGLGDYFYTRSWYKPNDSYSDNQINQTDKANIDLILKAENGENTSNEIASQNNSSNQIGDGENIEDDLEGIDGEAQKEAEKFWKKNYKQCGDSNFQHLHYPLHQMTQSPPYDVWVELKGMNWTVEGSAPQAKTEAERLNQRDNPSGIEWKGKTRLFVSALRYWASKNMSDATMGWNKWQDKSDAFETYEMIKQGGTWKFDKPNWFNDRREVKPVNCNELPK